MFDTDNSKQEGTLTFLPYLRRTSFQRAAFCLLVVAKRDLSQKKIKPGRRNSCSGCLIKAWMRMKVMKKVEV